MQGSLGNLAFQCVRIPARRNNPDRRTSLPVSVSIEWAWHADPTYVADSVSRRLSMESDSAWFVLMTHVQFQATVTRITVHAEPI